MDSSDITEPGKYHDQIGGRCAGVEEGTITIDGIDIKENPVACKSVWHTFRTIRIFTNI
mgnify:CR=1 FL=1